MWAAPAGLIAAAVLSLLAGPHTAAHEALDQMDQRLAALKIAGSPTMASPDDAANRALAAPLFALTTGPGAVSEVVVLLKGLAITPTRRAALVSIGGKPAEWLALGSGRDGVTLMDVQSGRITVDTATGFKDVGLWDNTADPSAPSPSTLVPTPAAPPAPAVFQPPPPAPSPMR